MKLAAALLLLAVSGPALPQGRLPRTVAPVNCDITVRPDAKAMTFSGERTVAVEVKEPTAAITLNAADLRIRRATFDGRAVPLKLDAGKQTVTLALPRAATMGRHVPTFSWSGGINESASGLFATDYVKADGAPARMLATQFEAPDAQRFAPMWDEPAFKAKFRLSAVAPAGQLAVSNIPVTSILRQSDGSQLYRFGETPVMSSHLLFLGTGDLERTTAKVGNVEVGVISRCGVVYQGDYALGAARKSLAYYDDYFSQPYPLPKLDMIAGPGSN